jgi:hypothetical protein
MLGLTCAARGGERPARPIQENSMHRLTPLAAACILALAVAACATDSASGGGAAASSDFKPTGSITSFVSNASFDASHVQGPKVNASLRSDGSWGGTIGVPSIPLFHTYKDGTLTGPNFTLNISKAGDVLTVTGQHMGSILRFEVSPTSLRVRTPSRSLDFNGDGNGNYSGAKTATFTGDAIALPPTVPMALALCASFM